MGYDYWLPSPMFVTLCAAKTSESRGAISTPADAEHEAFEHPTPDRLHSAKLLSQRLWALIPALLHQPPKADDVDPSRFDIAEIVRKRLQKAETGSWTQLY